MIKSLMLGFITGQLILIVVGLSFVNAHLSAIENHILIIESHR